MQEGRPISYATWSKLVGHGVKSFEKNEMKARLLLKCIFFLDEGEDL